VARLGGDEFALILPDISAENLEGTLSRILEMIRDIREIEGQRIEISGCLGITIFPDDPADGDGLVIHADQAMYAVKRQGKDGWGLYNSQFSLS